MLWRLSSRAKWVKAELALALLLVCLAGFLGIRETVNRSVRDVTYQQIIQASAQGDDVTIIEKTEKFLAEFVLAPDPRQEEVEETL